MELGFYNQRIKLRLIDCTPFIFIELVGEGLRDICYFVACVIFVIYVMFVFSNENGGLKQ